MRMSSLGRLRTTARFTLSGQDDSRISRSGQKELQRRLPDRHAPPHRRATGTVRVGGCQDVFGGGHGTAVGRGADHRPGAPPVVVNGATVGSSAPSARNQSNVCSVCLLGVLSEADRTRGRSCCATAARHLRQSGRQRRPVRIPLADATVSASALTRPSTLRVLTPCRYASMITANSAWSMRRRRSEQAREEAAGPELGDPQLQIAGGARDRLGGAPVALRGPLRCPLVRIDAKITAVISASINAW